MNKNIIAVLVIALIAIGGGAVYVLSQNNETDQSSNSSSQQNVSDNQTSNPEFDAVATESVDLVATITTTEGDKTFVGTMKQDKDSGNTSYEVDVEGKQALTVYTGDAYYFCQTPDNCIKYPLNQIGASNFDPDSYRYTDEKIQTIREGANYQGTQQCGNTSCDVWKVSNSGLDTTVFIDKTTKRIVQVESATPNGTAKITYEYKDVSVVPPANAKAIPSFQ